MNEVFNVRRRGTAGPRHVQDPNPVRFQKLLDPLPPALGWKNMQAGPGHFPGILSGKEGSTCQLPRERNDQCGIGVTDIPLGALSVIVAWCFLQSVPIRDNAVLCSAPLRAPSAMGNATVDCPVQRGTVSPCLPA